ncbi:MAG TPA: TRAP transporter small permease subunit [Calditrichia bacterium]|nr:TRAP transporter small permease subunit [Calditrichia bacterium]
MMNKLLLRFSRTVEALVEGGGYVVNVLSVLLVLTVVFDVLTSLAANSFIAAKELSWHIFAVMFLLGASYALKYDRHVRVDVFYANWPPRQKALLNILGTVVFLLPFMLMLFWTSLHFVAFSFGMGETSPNPGGLPLRWLLKAAIPTGAILVILQSLALLIRDVRILKGEGEGQVDS